MASINPTVLDCGGCPHVSGKTDDHIRLTITGISQDIGTNKTTINYKITVEGTPYVYLKALYVSLGNQVLFEQYSQILSSWSSGQIIKEGTATFNNNDDGSLSLTAYIKQLFYYDYSSSRWNNGSYFQEASRIMTCSTIARVSEPTLSASEINVGEEIKITTNRKSSSLTHKIYYSIGSINETCLASGVGDSYSWKIPKTIANQITNTDNATMTFKVVTVYNNGDIGYKTRTLKVKVPNTAEFQPTINNVALSEVGNVPSSIGAYVQNNSKIKGVISAGGAYGSKITSYSASINNATYNTSTFTTSIITLVNPTLTITVKDSRGRPATYSQVVTVLKYEIPTISNYSAIRNANKPAQLDLALNCKVYSLNNKNTTVFTLYYKKTSASSWSSITISSLASSTSNGIITYSKSYSPLTNLEANTSYDVYITVKDQFKTVKSKAIYINTSFKFLNITANKKYCAWGKMHERNGYNEHGVPEIFYENAYRHDGSYEGIMLSSPSITNGEINFSSANKTLEFDVNGTTYGITIWTSDERLKKDIKPIKDNYMDKIKAIEHIEFYYKDNPDKKIPIGYSANQLQTIDENFVLANGKEKILQPNISVLMPVITKTIQELINKVENLERKLEKYESN